MALYPVPDAPRPLETEAGRVRSRVKAMPKPKEMIQCHRCGGREVIETKTGALFGNGKATGGTKSLLCVACLLHGTRTELL